ncbi:MAG TPA: ATP-dependent DNA helicase RecQ [Flavisolibacter sp.]|nr:ATP-dependent DNA helicase RecQ [Flavisolibacter sp.]
MAGVNDILKQYWGYDGFRLLQQDIIENVLSGRDTLAILPTGGGKSICFQVPALARPGICIVVSPLIALMKDQVDNLKKRDIPALLIHSGMKRTDVVQTLRNATHDYFKFLYVSPERLETSLFNEFLPALNVNLIAIDEAHCISQWGYDFRPSYLRIAELRKELPQVPVLALTASATPPVQADICARLELKEPSVFRQSFERKNLSYSAFRVDSKQARLSEIISKVPGTAIVYCKSRKRTSEIMNLLQLQGIAASNYHAGLPAAERNERQKDWIENKVRVMVCTNAFGMGIDKPDVRLVVHADMPDNLENYYQEAGRAGRDGKKAYAVLLYNDKDITELQALQATRFPPLEKIRAVYHALVNFLQIPSYTGEYKSYGFRFDEFIRNFGLNSMEALYCLKALEQDGWLQFNERNFSPATLMFTTSKSGLYEFEKTYPQHEPLLTALLRTYGGIFDFPVFISENLIARLMKKEEGEIKKQLASISSYGIISYSPQHEEPQIIFLKHRVPAKELLFNLLPYKKRKETFVKRVEQMIQYACTAGCRSSMISRYFGDEHAQDCGTCDNCLQKKAGTLSAEEFERISGIIRQKLSQKQLTALELLELMGNVKKEKTWKVLEFLQAENKIRFDSKGLLSLK